MQAKRTEISHKFRYRTIEMVWISSQLNVPQNQLNFIRTFPIHQKRMFWIKGHRYTTNCNSVIVRLAKENLKNSSSNSQHHLQHYKRQKSSSVDIQGCLRSQPHFDYHICHAIGIPIRPSLQHRLFDIYTKAVCRATNLEPKVELSTLD